jgi:hypothetical protein
VLLNPIKNRKLASVGIKTKAHYQNFLVSVTKQSIGEESKNEIRLSYPPVADMEVTEELEF